jgi:hypothetical protein
MRPAIRRKPICSLTLSRLSGPRRRVMTVNSRRLSVKN